MHRRFVRTAAFALPPGAALLLAAGPASAHHLMGGRMPATFAEGLLSGLGHPVIGVDHLAFLVAVGVAVAVAGLARTMPFVFVAASAVGVAIHVGRVDLPASELLVAVSLLLGGFLLARGTAVRPWAWAALFAVAGVLHGYAYGESIAGAEPTPLAAYLAGLVLIQGALSSAVAVLVRRALDRLPARDAVLPRLMGAVVAGVGIAAAAAQIIPAG